eukprot:691416-Prymnesium_polylepis.1
MKKNVINTHSLLHSLRGSHHPRAAARIRAGRGRPVGVGSVGRAHVARYGDMFGKSAQQL